MTRAGAFDAPGTEGELLMYSLEPVFARLTLGFSVAGFIACAAGILSGEGFPNLLMDIGFGAILAAWMSWGMSEILGRVARIEVRIRRNRYRED
jgi:hypothetical protein